MKNGALPSAVVNTVDGGVGVQLFLLRQLSA
ncbi:hypothetical protein FHT93_002145 [Rhizobium sp. BK379]|nr:hypothetical protein [Rhizobium sp. BK379]